MWRCLVSGGRGGCTRREGSVSRVARLRASGESFGRGSCSLEFDPAGNQRARLSGGARGSRREVREGLFGALPTFRAGGCSTFGSAGRGLRAKAEENTREQRPIADLVVEPQERSWDGTGPRGFRKEQTPESVETLRGEHTGVWEPRVRGLPVPQALKGKEPYGSPPTPLVGEAAASGHTLKGRHKPRRGRSVWSNSGPAARQEHPEGPRVRRGELKPDEGSTARHPEPLKGRPTP